MNMDYSYFLMNNRLYYDELSTMSLLYANSIYMNDSGIIIKSENNKDNVGNYKNLKVKDMLGFYGFKDVKTYYMGTEDADGYEDGDDCRKYHKDDTHKGRMALGYKNIEYHGIDKTVIGIVIRGTAEDDDWDGDFDMGDIKLRDAINSNTTVSSGKENNTIYGMAGRTRNSEIIDTYLNHNSVLKYNDEVIGYDKKYFNELKHFVYGYPDWTHNYHHAGFDIVANRMLEIIEEYVDETSNKTNDDICFWVTGHSMGAGVANLVAAELISKGYKDQVYCYTFAAPNTFYLTDNTYERENYAIPGYKIIENYREPHGSKYRCIFNIVNEDDFVPEVPMSKCGWTKYGRTATISFNSNKYEIEQIIKNEEKYKIISYDRSVTKDYINNQYKGNIKTIENIVESFNSIFEDDPTNMRYDVYTFNDEDRLFSRDYYTNPIIPNNTKPFQKIERNTSAMPSQYQMPAYFMQYIAYCMHGGFYVLGQDIFDIGFLFAKFCNRYGNSQKVLVRTKDLIQQPHYLESYYLLTKKVSIVDFK